MNIFCQKILQGSRPSFAECIEALSPIFPWLLQLESTPQDPDWHAEGNVYIHTEMVLLAMYQLLNTEAAYLTPEDQLTLILAVVLHDVAKPVTTKSMEIRGNMRIAAPHHESRGASYIAYKLANLNLPFSIIYNVITLVAQHILPKLLVVKSKPASQYARLSRFVNLELLYYLEKADMLGRSCTDQAEQVAHIDLFRLFAQEYQLWGKSAYAHWRTQITSDLKGFSLEAQDLVLGNAILRYEQGLILTLDEEIARSYAYRNEFAELVILCGPSGSGKSTWIKQNLADFTIISLDQIRKKLTGSESDQSKNGQVLQLAKESLKAALRQHKKVVWDATNLRRDFRSIIADLGYAYKALVTLVVFYGNEESFHLKNNQRDRKIPRHVLQQQIDRLEWPEIDEAHRYYVVDESGKRL